MTKKLNFYDWLSTRETDDGSVDPEWSEHWKENLPKLIDERHLGDCTKACCTCSMCHLERMLKEYREYVFSCCGNCSYFKPNWEEGGIEVSPCKSLLVKDIKATTTGCDHWRPLERGK